ncbi:ABC-type uncharacterized transport system permease subunit [Sinobacterium caligoides]|uniref:ABC-type uncharacterized transport system permease subunit n=1 Tax=Sinobacterium caligoides TaxID=933926 RepID=A0A3N2E0W6_9GAMM|nr:cytochrome c biogenesis protein CcsA [Sinobacterium caligoides]ROS05215.1 ABC-type uncharacterized transport system permease subunit [Sinobacterium caligoides]
MSLTIISTCAVTLYIACSLYLGGQAWHGVKSPKLGLTAIICGFIALTGHGYVLLHTVYGSWGIDFSVLKVASLTFWFLTLSTLISSLRIPVTNILVPLYLIAGFTLVAAQLLHTEPQPIPNITFGISLHILLSILAYCVFTIAAMQAVTIGIQDKLLKNHKTLGLINTLPPLQTMETLLFDVLWAGQLLLTLALAAGLYSSQNAAEVLTTHKVVFAIIAWLVFSILLWGRHRLGWRGKVAIRWTLVGFLSLMLSYFGSKFVIEVILS